jgi:hypothetical protein
MVLRGNIGIGRYWFGVLPLYVGYLHKIGDYEECRMDLPGPTTSVGTRNDYSVGPWDYPTCAARHLLA